MDAIIRSAHVANEVHRLARVVRDEAPGSAQQAPVADMAALAEDALQLARREAEQAASILFQDAEQRGFEKGHVEGIAAGRLALDGQAERLGAVASVLAAAKAQVLAEAEDDMVELAFSALCVMLGENVATRDAVAEMVRLHSPGHAGHGQVVVRLHPADLALLEDFPQLAVQCKADATVLLGGCIVEGGAGSLDARLEVQLDRLRATLLAVRSERMQEARS